MFVTLRLYFRGVRVSHIVKARCVSVCVRALELKLGWTTGSRPHPISLLSSVKPHVLPSSTWLQIFCCCWLLQPLQAFLLTVPPVLSAPVAPLYLALTTFSVHVSQDLGKIFFPLLFPFAHPSSHLSRSFNHFLHKDVRLGSWAGWASMRFSLTQRKRLEGSICDGSSHGIPLLYHQKSITVE